MVQVSWLKWLGILATGLSVNAILQWAFEDLLWPSMLIWQGNVLGNCIMVALAFLYCLGTFAFYNRYQHDWLGIEAAKAMRVGKPVSKWIDRLTFFIMSLYDPFVATVYFRDGLGKYLGLSKRGWGIFLLSFSIGNVTWVAITTSAVGRYEGELAKAVLVLTILSVAVFPWVPWLAGKLRRL